MSAPRLLRDERPVVSEDYPHAMKMNLEDKITYSIELIRRGEKLALALNPQDGYFVGFSGGKDSQALLQLVKMAGVRYKAYYSVTTNDPPQNVYFIRQHYPDVVFLHPQDNFFKLVEKKGLPTMNRRYCCAMLKESAGVGCAVLTGVRAEESRKRAAYNEVKLFSRRKENSENTHTRTIEEIEENEHRCIQGKDKLMIFPILRWTESDVWQFLREQGLPTNPCYKQSGRVGCMFCPFSSKKQIDYYEIQYPLFKKRLLQSLTVFWERYNGHEFESPDQYFEWWKSKKSIKEYKANIAQYSINFEQ